MSDDIVDRLRNGAYADLFMQCAKGEVESCIRCDAADEIERLREVNAQLNGVWASQDGWGRVPRLEAEIERLRSLITAWADAEDEADMIRGIDLFTAYEALRKAVGR